MKKIYFSAAFLIGAVSAFAQVPLRTTTQVGISRAEHYVHSSGVGNRVPTDTIGLVEFAPGNTVIEYNSPGFGYLLGTNSQTQQGVDIKTFEVARGFTILEPFNVEGAMLFFLAKESPSNNLTLPINVNVYSMEPNKAFDDPNATSPDAMGPSTVVASGSIAFQDADTNFVQGPAPTFITFPTPAWVNGDFAIGVEYKDFYTGMDVIALWGDEIGDGGGLKYTFHKFGVLGQTNTFWAVTSSTFTLPPDDDPMDINAGIFAIVSASSVSVGDDQFLDGMQLSQNYPNPANGVVTINYALEKFQEKATLEIYAANGQLVQKIENKDQAAGKHSIKLDANLFSSGTYFYSLEVNGNRLTKRMVISK